MPQNVEGLTPESDTSAKAQYDTKTPKSDQKLKDLESSNDVQVTFQGSRTQNWVSIPGTATTTSNEDPRIKELYNLSIKAWFGDLGDGKHDGSAEGPRVSLIEVKSKHVAYWKSTVGAVGFVKEFGVGALTGQVASIGILRPLLESDLELARREKA
ncbi:hypothetical protein B0O99DRAFT_687447 [Bisporella sp. PMI_857]|nr:hypothetical protein B0O99DRAFT_687447 [Bisporella sp. PMI_857]